MSLEQVWENSEPASFIVVGITELIGTGFILVEHDAWHIPVVARGDNDGTLSI